jgi:hypothetical protein
MSELKHNITTRFHHEATFFKEGTKLTSERCRGAAGRLDILSKESDSKVPAVSCNTLLGTAGCAGPCLQIKLNSG